MSNPYRDYKTNFRNVRPYNVRYEPSIARYFVGDKRFTRAFEAEDYARYLLAFGSFYPYSVDENTPDLVSAFADEKYKANDSNQTFPSLFNFSRPSTATYVDSTGTLRTAASGEPRLGHHVWDGSQWVNKGLLLESESRTNVTQHNDSFTGWEKVGVTVSRDPSEVSPDGNSAWLISADLGVTSFRLADNNAVDRVPVEKSCVSVYLKQGSTRYAVFGYGGARNAIVVFDFSSEQVVDASATGEPLPENINVTNESNGWFRVSFTVSSSNRPGRGFGVFPSNSDVAPTSLDLHNQTSSSDVNDTVYIAFPQIEEGATPSSPIITNGSAVTRAGESLSIPAALLPYDSTAMSIAMEGEMTYEQDDRFDTVVPIFWNVNLFNQIRIALSTVGADIGKFYFRQDVEGDSSEVFTDMDAYSPGINVPFNIASRHTSSDINGAFDGTALTANTDPTALPDLSTTDLDLGFDFMGTIKTFRMWSLGLTDTQLEEATSP